MNKEPKTGGMAPQDPDVRRWPHPVNGWAPGQDAEPMIHYLRCALAYQNQMLADIKALLERLAPP